MTTPASKSTQDDGRHVPVLLDAVLAQLAPRAGEVYVDGTFGAGGYTQAILKAADCRVIAIDRDPDAIAAGKALVESHGNRLSLLAGKFSDMALLLAEVGIASVHGIVLDIGVSSMQLDESGRGFSFMRDGPLDMRMSQAGQSAADVVAKFTAEALANLIFVLGEEPKSRAIARAIVAAREENPILTTLQLVKAIERATGPQRFNMRTHPATKTFQALRIYVNGELDQLASALEAAEQLLVEGGRLVVVTFHSLEDRIVKRFFAERSGNIPSTSRHAPGIEVHAAPSFTLPFKGHLGASDEEMQANPRARSGKLRAGWRTSAKPHKFDGDALGVPVLGVPALRERRH